MSKQLPQCIVDGNGFVGFNTHGVDSDDDEICFGFNG
jgi:hypothetical protein